MKKWLFIAFSQLLVLLPAAQQPPINIDGQFSESQWQTAQVWMNEDSISILFFQTNDELCLGVLAGGRYARYVDVYIKSHQLLFNLHASFQLGERLLPDTDYNDADPLWTWGNNRHWRANTVVYRPDTPTHLPFRQQLMNYQGYEFVIQRAKLAAGENFIRIEIKGFEDGLPPIVFPRDSETYRERSWKRIVLK